MITMNIDAGQERLSKKQLEELGSNIKKVLADSYNRAAAGMRTDGTKLIVKNSGLKRSIVFPSFSIIKASPKSDSPEAKILIKGMPVPLINNKPRPVKPMTGKTKGGVTINLGRGKHNFKHAFIARMSSGYIGVFERQKGNKNGRGREIIKQLYGLSVPQIGQRDNIVQEVGTKAVERFNKRFEQQCDRFLRRNGAR